MAYDHPTHGTGRIEYGNADVYFSNEHGYFKALTQKGNEILTGSTSLKGQASIAYVVKMDLQVVQNIDGLKIYKNKKIAKSNFLSKLFKHTVPCILRHTGL